MNFEETKSQKVILEAIINMQPSDIINSLIEHEACGFGNDFIFSSELLGKKFSDTLNAYAESTGLKKMEINLLIFFMEIFYQSKKQGDDIGDMRRGHAFKNLIKYLDENKLLAGVLSHDLNGEFCWSRLFVRLKENIHCFSLKELKGENFKKIIQEAPVDLNSKNSDMPLPFFLLKNLNTDADVYYNSSFIKNLYLLNSLCEKDLNLDITNSNKINFFDYYFKIEKNNSAFDEGQVIKEIDKRISDRKEYLQSFKNQKEDGAIKALNSIKELNEIKNDYITEISKLKKHIYSANLKAKPSSKNQSKAKI